MLHIFSNDGLEDSIKERNKYFRSSLLGDSINFDALTIFPQGTNHAVAILVHTNCVNNIICNIHHESIHVATYILKEKGVIISHLNDEALAYLSTYIFKKTCQKLKLI